jgi:hypothetical protein
MVPLKNKGGKLAIFFLENNTNLLESVQLEAARIITRLRKGTSHEKLYTELIHVNLWELLGGPVFYNYPKLFPHIPVLDE